MHEWTRNLTHHGQTHPYIQIHVQKNIYTYVRAHVSSTYTYTHNSRAYQSKYTSTLINPCTNTRTVASPNISPPTYKYRRPAITEGKLTILMTPGSLVCSAESGLASPLAASSLSAQNAAPFPSPGPACVHAARGGRRAPRQSSRNSWQSLQGPRALPCASPARAGSSVRKSHGQLKTCSTCTGVCGKGREGEREDGH